MKVNGCIIRKLWRFCKNPAPYFEKIWFDWWMKPVVWPVEVAIYRRVMLPRLVKKVSKKEPIKVLFLAMSVAYWKYDTLYRRMAKDSRFSPVIMPAMRTNQSLFDQLNEHDELMEEFTKRRYNIIPGYDMSKGKFLSAKALKPDIVFYTHPYSGPGRIRRQYDFWAMRNSLVCYAPYFFPYSASKFYFNHPLQNAAWQLYCAYDKLAKFWQSVMDNKGVNAITTGYSFGDDLSELNAEEAEAAWKNDKSERKRIIWAPHHSISSTDTIGRVSTFLIYFEEMKEIAIKYKDRLLIAFKPHPVLYSRLVGLWGREKADSYFDFWRNSENTQLHTGDYLALFGGSDALIHDSGSFRCEYLYLDKPCMYLYRPDAESELNEVGIAALNAHYSGYKYEDIIEFIENVVIGGHDTKVPIRKEFRQTYLVTQSGKRFSENVIDAILAGLGRQEA